MCFADKLKVLKVWDEPHSGAPTGDFPDTLHQEGRAAQVILKNSPNDVTLLSRLAVCAGFDFIQHKGTLILINLLNL